MLHPAVHLLAVERHGLRERGRRAELAEVVDGHDYFEVELLARVEGVGLRGLRRLALLRGAAVGIDRVTAVVSPRVRGDADRDLKQPRTEASSRLKLPKVGPRFEKRILHQVFSGVQFARHRVQPAINLRPVACDEKRKRLGIPRLRAANPQQFFFVSCSLQHILGIQTSQNRPLAELHRNFAIQMNDTHPALCVAELMRILLDQVRLPWEQAWSITLRTLVLKGQTVYLQAGAGIVADSEPEKEREETVNKAMGLLRALEMAETQL